MFEIDVDDAGTWKRIPRLMHSIDELLGVVKTLAELMPETDFRIRRIKKEN